MAPLALLNALVLIVPCIKANWVSWWGAQIVTIAIQSFLFVVYVSTMASASNGELNDKHTWVEFFQTIGIQCSEANATSFGYYGFLFGVFAVLGSPLIVIVTLFPSCFSRLSCLLADGAGDGSILNKPLTDNGQPASDAPVAVATPIV